MAMRSIDRVVIAVTAFVLCGPLGSLALAQSPESAGALIDGKVSAAERARIAALPDNGLADLVRAGTRGQREAAVAALAARDRGEMLLALAKEGPRAASDIVIELYVPKAVPGSNARAKELAGAYVTWLEGQLKSDSPVVRPERAVRSLARTVYWSAAEHPATPDKPAPEPRYQYRRVVGDLIGLLQDKRPMVRDAVVDWLANVGGYAAEQSQAVTAALRAYGQVLAAQPVGNEKERKGQEMRLAAVNRAIDDVIREQKRRADTAAKQPDPLLAPGAQVPDK